MPPSVCAILLAARYPGITPVCSLLFHRRPFAVIRSVITFIINAFNRVLWGRTWPHIGIKVFKFHPTNTNSDAAPTVISIGRTVRIIASLQDTLPCFEFRRARHAMGGLSLSNARHNLAMEAPA